MAVDLNADVGQIIKAFFNKEKGASAGKGSWMAENFVFIKGYVLKTMLVVFATITICGVIGLLTSVEKPKQKAEFQNSLEIEAAINKTDSDIVFAKDIFGKNKQKVIEKLPQFSEINGSEQLFRLISQLAERKSLIINNVVQGGYESLDKPTSYSRNNITLELEGSFANFSKMLKELSEIKSVMNVIDLSIMLNESGSSERRLKFKTILNDYEIDKKRYEQITKISY